MDELVDIHFDKRHPAYRSEDALITLGFTLVEGDRGRRLVTLPIFTGITKEELIEKLEGLVEMLRK